METAPTSSLTAAAVGQILTHPRSSTWVSGKRAVGKRRISRFKAIAGGLTLGAVLAWNGVPEELSAHLKPSTLAPAAAVTAQWVELANPLVDVGKRADGSFDAYAMLRSWKAAGLSRDESELLIHAVQNTPPVLLLRDDPVVLHELRTSQQNLVDALQVKFPQAFEKLQAQARRPFADRAQRNWSKDDWKGLTQAWEGYRTQSPVEAVRSSADLATAQRLLARAGQDVGLRGLMVSWEDLSNPSRLMNLADNLRQANQDLKTVTGWDGQLLGLNGNVMLYLNRPSPSLGASGFATMDDRGVVSIVAQWDALAHEWLHGVDYLSGRVVPKASLGTLMTEQSQKPLRLYNNWSQGLSWQRLLKDVEATSPQWFAHKHRAHEKAARATAKAGASSWSQNVQHDGYWLRPTETLSFAFETHVAMNPAVKVLGKTRQALELENSQGPQRLPSIKEVTAQSPYWQAFFDANKHLLPSESLGTLRAQRVAQKAPSADVPSRLSPAPGR